MPRQMTFLQAEPPPGAAPVWALLDPEERASIVTLLARLVTRMVAPMPSDDSVADSEDRGE